MSAVFALPLKYFYHRFPSAYFSLGEMSQTGLFLAVLVVVLAFVYRDPRVQSMLKASSASSPKASFLYVEPWEGAGLGTDEPDAAIAAGTQVQVTGIEIYDLDDGDTLYFDSSTHRGFVPPAFAVGQGAVIKAFDATSVGRKSGHVVTVTCSADQAFGINGFAPWNIPPERNLLIYYTPTIMRAPSDQKQKPV